MYKVVRALKQKEDEEKRDDRSFAMKVIRLEGKDRDARARALRSLVEETHFALRVRRVAGVVPPRARPPRAPRARRVGSRAVLTQDCDDRRQHRELEPGRQGTDP